MDFDVKLIALDLDDTLIDPIRQELTEENRRAVRAAKEKGVLVTVATGRIYPFAKKWVEMLDIDMKVIASNGADLRKDGKSLHRETISGDLTRQVFQRLEGHELFKFAFSGDYVYCTPQDKNKELFTKWGYMKGEEYNFPLRFVDSWAEVLPHVEGDTQKILLWSTSGRQQQLIRKELEGFADVLDIVCGGGVNLEITPKGVTKGAALKRVAKEYGIAMENVMAVGDSENDVSMLQVAGVPIVVANAQPEAKAAAIYEVATCEENGVAQAIRRFVL
ncbi:Cof-type HAD-IIB family hydrolase [Christensenellaceae bacterium OttesenSCG-928-K19]|nr:Cof-type HAD-IIB family hydrolase [Christensenellaceae bacterium OttesenSCG-928-K19]